MANEAVEIIASRHPSPKEMDAYERVLGDAMAGDATLFAREDYVEEAWRIVDPVLKAGTSVSEYEKGDWGPGRGRAERVRRREAGTIQRRRSRKITALAQPDLDGEQTEKPMKLEVFDDADSVAESRGVYCRRCPFGDRRPRTLCFRCQRWPHTVDHAARAGERRSLVGGRTYLSGRRARGAGRTS